MWKIFAAFVAFALLALFVIMKGGDKIDMQGEAGAHNPTEASSPSHGSAPAAPAAPVPPAAPAATTAPAEASPASK